MLCCQDFGPDSHMSGRLSLFNNASGPELHHEPSDQGAVLWTENRMEEEFLDGDGRSAELFCAKSGLFPKKAMDFPRPTKAILVR
jgi:hypothetical protein